MMDGDRVMVRRGGGGGGKERWEGCKGVWLGILVICKWLELRER